MKNAANPDFTVYNTVEYKVWRNDDISIACGNHDRRIGAERSTVIRCCGEFSNAGFELVEHASGCIRIVQTDVIKDRIKIINGLLRVANPIFSQC